MARPLREMLAGAGRWVWAAPRRVPPPLWLAASIVTYFALSVTLSSIRFTGFRVQTWDIGIFQQAFWSFNHGRGFFDAADYELHGVPTFLGIHPSFLMYPLGYLYGVAPSVVTLFVVQAAAVALAAVPLYLLATQLSGSTWKGLLCGGMFLLWAPTLAGTLFDFHLEAFLPLEMFTLVLFWVQRRFWLAALPAVIASLSLEVGPIFVAACGLFFLLESFAARAGGAPPTGGPQPSMLRSGLARTLRFFRAPPAAFGVACVAGGAVAYLALRYVEANLFGGAGALAAGSGALPALIDPFRYGVRGFSLDLRSIAENLFPGLSYWVLVYALLAFIPLRALRTLVLSLPWFAFTLIAQHSNYFLIGNQYGFVAAFGAFVGFAYGLSTLPLASIRDTLRTWWADGTLADPHASEEAAELPRMAPESMPASASRETAAPVDRAGPRPGITGRCRPARGTALWTAALLAALALNVALSPLNPLLAQSPLGAGYRVDYSVPALYGQIAEVTALIPAGAYLLASSDLFPYAANDAHAYTTVQAVSQPPPLYFPFNASNPPPYVLVSEDWYDVLPTWLDPMLWNASEYGLRAVIGESPHGWILLLEQHYSGPSLTLSVTPFVEPTYYNTGSGVVPGSAARYAVDNGTNGAQGGTGIVDNGTLGTAWRGPGFAIPAGHYAFNLAVRMWRLNAPLNATTPLLSIWVTTIGEVNHCPTSIALDTPAYRTVSLNGSSAPQATDFNNFTSDNSSEGWWFFPFSTCLSAAAGLPYFTPGVQFFGVVTNPGVGVEFSFVRVDAV